MNDYLTRLHDRHSLILSQNHDIRMLNWYGNPCYSVPVSLEVITEILGHEPPLAHHYRIEFMHSVAESVKLEALYNNEVETYRGAISASHFEDATWCSIRLIHHQLKMIQDKGMEYLTKQHPVILQLFALDVEIYRVEHQQATK